MMNLEQLGQNAKKASKHLTIASAQDKNDALKKIADELLIEEDSILDANKKDIDQAIENEISTAVIDRIRLSTDMIKSISEGLYQLTELDDPIGRALTEKELDNGIILKQVTVPIGVVGIVYEARPNVTVDASALCLKAGNAIILRGSSSAIYSNLAIVKAIRQGLDKSKLPTDSVQLLEDTSRETADKFFQLDDYLDVLIPRGSQGLIDHVIKQATVPVIETGAGNCHIYIDEDADLTMASEIVINAKTQRPSVCNAVETILIHEEWFDHYGEALIQQLQNYDVEIRGDEVVRQTDPTVKTASLDDWTTEYLDLIVAIKVVSSTDEAIEHINKYGTSHSEAIITESNQHAVQFLNEVDAACVYHNASTRFTDGFEFGFGAEIGISTQKLHARGPMGLEALTSTKYQLSGNGQYKE